MRNTIKAILTQSASYSEIKHGKVHPHVLKIGHSSVWKKIILCCSIESLRISFQKSAEVADSHNQTYQCLTGQGSKEGRYQPTAVWFSNPVFVTVLSLQESLLVTSSLQCCSRPKTSWSKLGQVVILSERFTAEYTYFTILRIGDDSRIGHRS